MLGVVFLALCRYRWVLASIAAHQEEIAHCSFLVKAKECSQEFHRLAMTWSLATCSDWTCCAHKQLLVQRAAGVMHYLVLNAISPLVAITAERRSEVWSAQILWR